MAPPCVVELEKPPDSYNVSNLCKFNGLSVQQAEDLINTEFHHHLDSKKWPANKSVFNDDCLAFRQRGLYESVGATTMEDHIRQALSLRERLPAG